MEKYVEVWNAAIFAIWSWFKVAALVVAIPVFPVIALGILF